MPPIKLTLEKSHLRVENNDPVRTRYERSLLSYNIDPTQSYVSLKYEGSEIARLDTNTVNETDTPIGTLDDIIIYLSGVTDVVTVDGSVATGGGGGGGGLTKAETQAAVKDGIDGSLDIDTLLTTTTEIKTEAEAIDDKLANFVEVDRVQLKDVNGVDFYRIQSTKQATGFVTVYYENLAGNIVTKPAEPYTVSSSTDLGNKFDNFRDRHISMLYDKDDNVFCRINSYNQVTGVKTITFTDIDGNVLATPPEKPWKSSLYKSTQVDMFVATEDRAPDYSKGDIIERRAYFSGDGFQPDPVTGLPDLKWDNVTTGTYEITAPDPAHLRLAGEVDSTLDISIFGTATDADDADTIIGQAKQTNTLLEGAIEVTDRVVTDNNNITVIIRDTIKETDGTVTSSQYNLDGTPFTGTLAAPIKLAGADIAKEDYELVSTQYKATTANTGYAVGDKITQVRVFKDDVLDNTLWFNDTSDAPIAAVTIADLAVNEQDLSNIETALGKSTDAVTDATVIGQLKQIAAYLDNQKEISDRVVIDANDATVIIRTTIDESDGTITETQLNLDGTPFTGTLTPPIKLASATEQADDYEIVNVKYIANTAGTGYDVDDYVSQIRVFTNGVLTATSWYNDTQNAAIATVDFSHLTDLQKPIDLTKLETNIGEITDDKTAATVQGKLLSIIDQLEAANNTAKSTVHYYTSENGTGYTKGDRLLLSTISDNTGTITSSTWLNLSTGAAITPAPDNSHLRMEVFSNQVSTTLAQYIAKADAADSRYVVGDILERSVNYDEAGEVSGVNWSNVTKNVSTIITPNLADLTLSKDFEILGGKFDAAITPNLGGTITARLRGIARDIELNRLELRKISGTSSTTYSSQAGTATDVGSNITGNNNRIEITLQNKSDGDTLYYSLEHDNTAITLDNSFELLPKSTVSYTGFKATRNISLLAKAGKNVKYILDITASS